jgi:RND family efflux transporter MFP subunit
VRLPIALSATAAASLAVPALLWLGGSPPGAAPAQGVLPQQRMLTVSVTTSGTVRLRSGASVRVGSQVSGVVRKLNVTVGSHIRRGEVIAQIDPRTLEARVAQARAQVAVDEVAWEKAQRDLARLQRLADLQLVPQQQMEDLGWQVKSAAARLDKSHSDLAAAQVDLSYAVVRAPISGTVASVSTQEGETVAASFNAPTFVTIIEDGALELVAMVDETDIAEVRPGNAVSFTVEAYPSKEFSATVRRIDPTASILSGVVNYPVIGVLLNTADAGTLRPDMTANITIVTGQRAALLVPVSAVVRDGERSFVYLAQPAERATAPRRAVRTGIRQGDLIEVQGGLAAQDRIIVSPPAARGRGAAP